jgi:hypothetical protein
MKKDYSAFLEISKKRDELGLNPICPKCCRVMRTKRKDKLSGEYFCVCSPGMILCMG